MTLNKAFFLRLIDNWPIKILSLTAAVVLSQLYNINNLEERFFTIPVEIRKNDKFTTVNSSVNKVRIRLRGSEEEIFSVMEEDITAYVDLSSKVNEGEFQAPILLKKNGSVQNLKNLEISVEPINIRTHLEEKLARSIVVQPKFSEYPLTGYELVNYYTSPSAVTVTGPRSQVEDLQFISTESIDLIGRFEDFNVKTRLFKESDDISISGGDVVEFIGIISEIIIKKTIPNIDIVCIDLPENLIINGILPKASITVQGTQLRVENIRQQDLHFMVDCSGIMEPGHYSLPIDVDIPDGISTLKYNPPVVELDVILISENEGDEDF